MNYETPEECNLKFELLDLLLDNPITKPMLYESIQQVKANFENAIKRIDLLEEKIDN